MQLKNVSELKYLGCVLNESGTDEVECRRKAANGRRVGSVIRSLVNVRGLQLECARVFHETLLVSVLIYGSEMMIWKEEGRSRIRAVQMDKIRSLLGIKRMDRVPNPRIRELCGVAKGVDESIEEDVLYRFNYVERMENDRIAKRVYVGEYAGSRSVGQPWKEEVINTVKDCLKKIEKFGYQARKENGP